MKLTKDFYLNDDVLDVAKQLLNKHLCTLINGELTVGKIVETEAYKAPEDMGSHAYNNKRTPRTAPFFMEGGIAYVYLIYGTYNLFNVITNKKDVPEAVLIRGVEPVEGVDIMLERRNMNTVARKLTAGPGLLSIALGIELEHNCCKLTGDQIWIEDRGCTTSKDNIIASPRVGMNIPEPWKSIPWRFRIKDSKWTSPAK